MKISLFLILCAAIYLLSFWGAPFPFTGDQKVYLSIALEMRERGSWLIPYLFGEPSFLKPPLQFWATLLSWNVFGFSLFGALVPSLIALLGSSFLVKRLAIRTGLNQEQSLAAGIFLFGTVGSLTYGTTAQMDVWILLMWLAAWDFSCEFIKTRNVRYLFLAWITAGIMSWLKGPLYSVIWGISFWVLLAVERVFLQRKFILLNVFATIVGAVLGLSWFALAYQQFPDQLMVAFFHVENREKLGGNASTASGLWLSFIVSLLPILFWGLGRWNLVQIKKILSPQVLLMFVPLAAFFTFFPYIVGSYLYPVTPLYILLIISCVRVSKKITFFLGLFLVLIGSWLSYRMYNNHWISGAVSIVLSFTLLAWSIALVRAKLIYFALLSVLILGWIRFATVEIGSVEFSRLTAILSKYPDQKVFFKATSRNMWHEYGWVSSIVGRPIFAPPDLSGKEKILILEDAEYLSLSDSEKRNCDPWLRLGKRAQISWKEFVFGNMDRFDVRIQRQFFVCKDRN